MELDTDALIQTCIRDARLPRHSSYREPEVLLRMADEQTRLVVVPELLRVGGEQLVTSVSRPIQAGRSRYRMPARAIRLKDVNRLLGDGKVDEDFVRAEAPQALRWAASAGKPRFWYFESRTVVLSPPPDSSEGTLRISFTRKPSRLVQASAAYGVWVVQSLDVGANTLTLSGGQEAPGVGEVLDLVRGTPDFESFRDEATVTASSGSSGVWTVELDGDFPSDLEAGDYLSLTGTTPVPQIPEAYHRVLSLAVVVELLRELRDVEGRAAAKDKLAEAKAQALDTVAPRAREPRVLVQRDWL